MDSLDLSKKTGIPAEQVGIDILRLFKDDAISAYSVERDISEEVIYTLSVEDSESFLATHGKTLEVREEPLYNAPVEVSSPFGLVEITFHEAVKPARQTEGKPSRYIARVMTGNEFFNTESIGLTRERALLELMGKLSEKSAKESLYRVGVRQ